MLKKLFIALVIFTSNSLLPMQRLVRPIVTQRLFATALKTNHKFARNVFIFSRLKNLVTKTKEQRELDAEWDLVCNLIKKENLPSFEQIKNLSHDSKLAFLILAIQKNNKELVKFLVCNAEININARYSKYLNDQSTALTEAVRLSNDEIDTIDFLIKNGAYVNCSASITNDKTPLDIAISHKKFKVAKLLIEYGAEHTQNVFDNVVDQYDPNCDFIKYMIEKGYKLKNWHIQKLRRDFDKYIKNYDKNGAQNIIKVLSKVPYITDEKPYLIWAIERNDQYLAEFLLEVGASPLESYWVDKETKHSLGFSIYPLDLALQNKMDIKLINLMIDKGASITGNNAILLLKNNKDYTDLLLKDIKLRVSYYQNNPDELLHEACKELNYEVVECLFEIGIKYYNPKTLLENAKIGRRKKMLSMGVFDSKAAYNKIEEIIYRVQDGTFKKKI